MRVTLFRPFQDPYRLSMQLYADRLEEALRPLLPNGSVRSFHPRPAFVSPRLLRYAGPYLLYPLQARRAQADLGHIADHAYGHLLYFLDPSRSVVTVHDTILWKEGGLSKPVRALILRGISRAAAVICDSHATRDALLALIHLPPKRMEVIPLGVDHRFFEPAEGSPRERLKIPPGRYLLHVGHNKPYKNIPGLLRLLSLLSKERWPDLRLLRVGTRLTPEQERLAAELQVSDRIVQLGLVGPEELPSVYRCAELLLFPSLDEGFGLPVLEAMASGLPVVASNRGALPEVVGKAGILVDPSDLAGAARQVERLLAEPGLRRELRDAGRERACGFTWEKTAASTLEIYRRILRGALPS